MYIVGNIIFFQYFLRNIIHSAWFDKRSSPLRLCKDKVASFLLLKRIRLFVSNYFFEKFDFTLPPVGLSKHTRRLNFSARVT